MAPAYVSLTNSRTLSARSPWLQGSKCLVTGGIGEGTTLHKKPRPTIPSTFQILLHGSLGVAPSPLHTPRAGRKWHAFLITKGSFSCKLSNSGSLGQVPPITESTKAEPLPIPHWGSVLPTHLVREKQRCEVRPPLCFRSFAGPTCKYSHGIDSDAINN